MSAPTLETFPNPEPDDGYYASPAKPQPEGHDEVAGMAAVRFNSVGCAINALPLAVQRVIDERRFQITAHYRLGFDEAEALTVAEINERFFRMLDEEQF